MSPFFSRRRTRQIASSLAVFGVVAAGCSIGDTAENVAEEVIEGDLATQTGVGTIDASCPTPPDQDVGTTFRCTATSDLGELRFLAEIQEGDIVFVRPLNVMDDNDLTAVAAAATDIVGTEVGIDLDPELMDCGEAPVRIEDDLSFRCELTDPINADVYEATITFADEDFEQIDVELSEEPIR